MRDRVNDANQFMEFYKPYMFQNWSKELQELTFPFEVVRLEECDIDLFYQEKFFEMKSTISNFEDSIARVDTECFFAKYFTRSPKDSFPELKFKDVNHFLEEISISLRVVEDFIMTFRTDYKDLLNFYVRPFVEIPQENEFRAFKIDGVISITQYHRVNNPYWHENAVVLKQSIIDFVNKVDANFELDNFCCDLFVKDNFEIKLIEINPYNFSDPIFFNSHENLDGRMILIIDNA